MNKPMNSFTKSSLSKWIPAFVGFLALSIVAFQYLAPLFDSFWHVRVAKDFFEQGLSPFKDNYSYTFAGEKVAWLPFIAESIMYGFTLIGGEIFGLQLYLFCSLFISSLILLNILSKRNIDNTLKCLSTLLFAAIFLHRREPRPESICMIIFMFQLRLVMLNELSIRTRLIQFVLLQLIWSAIHTSSVLGYVLGFALFCDVAFDSIASKNATRKFWFEWCVAGICALGAGFFNLDFAHILTWHLGPVDDWALIINEYYPFKFHDLFTAYGWMIFLGPLLLIGSLWRKRAGEVILLVVFGLYALKAVRIAPLYAVVALPILFVNIELLRTRLKTGGSSRKLRLVSVLTSLAIVFLGFSFFNRAFLLEIPFGPGFYSSHHPVDVIEFMSKNGLKGRIRNQLESGGFILSRLGPTKSIFIDGRVSLLYPFDFTRDAFAAQANLGSFLKETQKYDYEYVIPDVQYPNGLFETALASGKFHLQFLGEAYALLSKEPTNFPIGTRLMLKPHCVSTSDLSQIELESKLSQEILPQRSPLRRSLEIAKKYFNREKIEEFERFEILDQYQPQLARTLGEFALKAGRRELARAYLGQINRFRNRDIILLATLDCEFNRCEHAETIMAQFPSELMDGERALILQILDRAKSIRPLRTYTDASVEQIRGYLRSKYQEKGLPLPDLNSDCL